MVPLFDGYRVFYNQNSDLEAAEKFLSSRLNKNESIIFMAKVGAKAMGFTQLYFTFSSVSMEPFLILNDLYVTPDFRGLGVGEKLLTIAKSFCSNNGYKGLALETAVDNPAQYLYEKLGWKKDTDFFHYFWKNPK
ncbi:GNAT family N-acetyltransferase [Croceivirga thetidis]|uniref:GNAT family N-acetyltransferase n=1 Tax=Croceivirga thetidis TaxID=2721623 RepID=UPI001FF0C157|nr:GNAT family N-acetyltransferase [Croceivirga thetidis]